jgi:ATP-dependent Lhr-like helicase
LRDDLSWLLADSDAPPSSRTPDAEAVAAVLDMRGACFVPELMRATGLPGDAVEQALWDLVSAGTATCDGFAGLRQLLGSSRTRAARRPAPSAGRWSLLRRPAPDAPSSPEPRCPAPEGGASDAALERLAHQYLRRYGVVFRDLLARESAPPWRDLVRVYRSLEARGAIRGGRFVQGFSGEQFALAESIDALRAVRRAPHAAERVDLSASDPLNLAGILTPGPRVHPGRGARVVLVDGVPTPSPAASEPAPGAADHSGTAPTAPAAASAGR